MTLLDDALARGLERRRLRPRWASPTAADGGRRGTALGSGMEFSDHREYQEGDDLRHLDPHVYARLGRPYVKRYAADRGLDVAILVDVSASMEFGLPTKREVSARLAAALAYVAVAGGDRVRLASFAGGSALRWRPSITSTRHVGELVAGIEASTSEPVSATDLRAIAAASARRLPVSGVTIVLSDWWTDDPEGAVDAFARSGRELLAVQVLAPEEEDPRLLPEGHARLEDAETGEELDLSLGGDLHGAYERGLAAWRARFHAAVEGVRGRVLSVRTDRSLPDVVLDEWRRAGVVS